MEDRILGLNIKKYDRNPIDLAMQIFNEYKLEYDFDSSINRFTIYHYDKVFIYMAGSGKWRMKNRSRWYFSKSPRQFVKKYVLEVPDECRID